MLFVIAVLIISFFGRKALGQPAEESVTLGSIELRLGMAEGVVLERLGEKYDVSEYGHSVWWVKGKVKPEQTADLRELVQLLGRDRSEQIARKLFSASSSRRIISAWVRFQRQFTSVINGTPGPIARRPAAIGS